MARPLQNEGNRQVSSQDNKNIVARFFELTNQRDYDAAEELLDDDLVWWLAGDPEKFFLAGNKTKAESMQGLRQTATIHFYIEQRKRAQAAV